MCMHAKGQQLSCLSLKEPVSIKASDRVIKKLAMSVLSRVREWVRMKRGSRYCMLAIGAALKSLDDWPICPISFAWVCWAFIF